MDPLILSILYPWSVLGVCAVDRRSSLAYQKIYPGDPAVLAGWAEWSRHAAEMI